MTQIDKACKYVKEDITAVFSSEVIKKLVIGIDDIFGAKSSNVFPIQNYVSESKLNLPMNILALQALNGITRLAALTLASQAREPPMGKVHSQHPPTYIPMEKGDQLNGRGCPWNASYSHPDFTK